MTDMDLTIVDSLFSQSEEVVQKLESAATKKSNDQTVAELREAVEKMVQAYANSWPKIAPAWSTLQQEQSQFHTRVQHHSAILEQGVSSLSYMLSHPTHGAQVKLQGIYRAEENLRNQLSHGESASNALELVREIREHIRTLESPTTQQDTCNATEKFKQLESRLHKLESLDSGMTTAEFFISLRSQSETLRISLVNALMQQLDTLVRASRKGREGTSSAMARMGVALKPDESISLSVASAATATSNHPSISGVFSALHALHATQKVIESLSNTILYGFIRPLVQYVEHHPRTIHAALYFSTAKTSMGKTLTISLAEPSGDESVPSLEGNILEILLTLVDFVWQTVFAAGGASDGVTGAADSSNPPPSMSLLAGALAPKLAPFIQSLCTASLPRSVAEVMKYTTTTGNKWLEFEQQAKQRGLIVTSDSTLAADGSDATEATSSIQQFLSHVQPLYISSLRSRVLERTKELVIRNTFETKLFGPAEANGEEDKLYPSIFHSSSPTPSPSASLAQELLKKHTQQIFSSSAAASSATSGSHSSLSHHHRPYSISQTCYAFTKQIYELYYEALEAREHISESCFHSLFTTLRDSIHLFLAISPVYGGHDLESVMHLSFMFFNDCRFLAAHLNKIQSVMTSRNQDTKKENIDDETEEKKNTEATEEEKYDTTSPSTPLALNDLSTPLRELGEKYFLLHVTRQRNALTELLDVLNSLNDIEDSHAFQSHMQSMKQTLHQLQSMGKIWLQLGVTGWPLTLGLMLEQLVSLLSQFVLSKSDIGVDGASRIHSLFSLVLSQYPHLDVTYTPSWSLFQSVTHVIHPDQSLAKLSTAFSNGELNALTSEELSSLIKSLYQESSHRTRFLSMIASATGAEKQQRVRLRDVLGVSSLISKAGELVGGRLER